jgi:hypothetical protein
MTTADELKLVETEEEMLMPSDKPLFESRDLGSTPAPNESLFDVNEPGAKADQKDEDGKKKYLGPERRKDNRRSQTDRRGEVRFDVNSNDRRESSGRRKDDKSPKFW